MAVNDIRKQLAALIHPGFVARPAGGCYRICSATSRPSTSGWRSCRTNLQRDRDYTHRIEEIQQEYRDTVAQLPPARKAADGVQQVPWMIEELRVSYFAQAMGTAYPVSDVRIYRAIDAL